MPSPPFPRYLVTPRSKYSPQPYSYHREEILQWYRHVKRMPKKRVRKLIMDWIPRERRKSGRPRKTWMEGVVQAAMTTRNLEPDQWRNREE